jgi:urease accessory protein
VNITAEVLGAHAPELASFQDEPPQMASGAVGKSGFLKLGFERRGEKTILASLEQRVPYLVQRALYWDTALPDLPCVFVITTSGCVLQGDRLALEIDVAEGAHAHVTTQAATKIHTMDSNYAAGTQAIHLRPDAYLEFLPEPTIPHRNSRYISDTRITVAPSATLLHSEITLCGRKHHRADERFGFDVFSATIAARRPDDRPLFTEKYVIEPKRGAMDRAGLMGPYDVFGNVILLTPPAHANTIREAIGAAIDHEAGLAWGASRLPNDAGLVFKALGTESAPVKAKVREFWSLARRTVLGADVPREFLWR